MDLSNDLKLYYASGSNPKDYRLSLRLDANSRNVLDVTAFSPFDKTGEPVPTYLVEVAMDALPEGYVEMSLEIGKLNLPLNGVVMLRVVGASGTVGEGTIRVEEGEQESRPIPEM